MAHSLTDSSASKSYLSEVNGFLDYVEKHQTPIAADGALDRALCKYQAAECYRYDRHSVFGEFLMNGMQYLWPTLRLQEAWRVCKSWSRVVIPNEGEALPEEQLAVMEDHLRSAPDVKDQIAGCLIPVQVDTYGREGECLSLCKKDVTDTGVEVALTFRTTKTGFNQGVRVDTPYAMQIIRDRVALCKSADSKLFPITDRDYQKSWRKAAKFVGTTKPPHSCRHTGPSRDLATGYRSQPQVQRRGRWASEKSVRRYAKTHVWIRIQDEMPPWVQKRGAFLLSQRQPRPHVARE